MPKGIENNREPIAIVGAACRFPGANNLDQFWNLLVTGRDAVSVIPDWRWSKDFYFHPSRGEPGKSYTWAAGVVDDIDKFDAAFFGISPREARQIDPQQRLILEVTAEALEDAGVPATNLAGSGTGVWMGASGSDYANARMGDPSGGDAYFMTGTTTSIVANRISYAFDLRGPSLVVDTACSSSLVALHLACEAIRQEQVPLALVGGVNLLLSPYAFIGFCRASMLSPHGRCFAFDSKADGYVRAEGAAVVVLKPLARALADQDAIRGLIRGTGTNSDGHTVGLSLPNRAAQIELLRSVYRMNNIAPSALRFIEAHGTGTAVGDPIELSALGEALAQYRTEPLLIGSVKTNLGHLETASGMAGLLKAMLSLQERVVPPSLNFTTPNPQISFVELGLEVVTNPISLPDEESQLLAGVNSFGFGGTNAHAIIASAPKIPKRTESQGNNLPPLLVSARSMVALGDLADAWSTLLAEMPAEAAAPLLRGAARRRSHYQHRIMAYGKTPGEIATALKSRAENERQAAIVSGTAVASGKLAFVFSGNGSQWVGMARDAIAYSDAFLGYLIEVDAALQPLLGWSVRDRLSSIEDTQMLAFTSVAQPMLFAVQVAITKALRAIGVEAAACVGHSVGEIAAAWAAGALSLTDACRIVVARSQQQERTRGAGRMAVLGLAPEKASEVVAQVGGGLEIGAYNSRSAVTVAGPLTAIEALRIEAEREGWPYTPLDLEYAFHSAVFESVRDDLIAQLADLSPVQCGELFVSTVTGRLCSGETLGSEHWWRNIRDPVRFHEAMDHLVRSDFRTFVEIGPSPILQAYVRSALREANVEGSVLGTLTRQPLNCDPFPVIAASCYVAGYNISKSTLFDGEVEFRKLPRYPWQRERHWFDVTSENIPLTTPCRSHTLLGFQRDPRELVWLGTLDLALFPWLTDHTLEGIVIVPAAAMVEMALAACSERFGDVDALEIVDFEIPRALTLEKGQSRQLRVRCTRDGRLEIESRRRLSEDTWNLHAFGRIQITSSAPTMLKDCDAKVRVVDAPNLYQLATKLGLEYGPAFRVVSRVEIIDSRQAIVRLDPTLASSADGTFVIHPAMLDGALQGFIGVLAELDPSVPDARLLPWRFGLVRAFKPYGRMPACARIVVKRYGTRSVCCAIALYDSTGRSVAEVDNCWLRQLPHKQGDRVAECSFYFDLLAAPRPNEAVRLKLDVTSILSRLQLESGADSTSARNDLLFEAYLASSAYDTLKAVLPTGAAFAVSELSISGTVRSDKTALLASMLRLLERHGGASEADGQWRLAEDFDLPVPAAIWRTILEDAPDLVAELTLAASAANTLPSAFSARTHLATVPSKTFVEQLLYDSPAGRRVTDDLCRVILALVAQWPSGRPLRILEVGADSGVLSRRLVRQLAGRSVSFSYTATDRDSGAVERLALALRRQDIAVSVESWNPAEGAYVGATPSKDGFDVVVSGYGLTRHKLNETALAALHGVLGQNGLLIATEPTPSPLLEIIFGQDPEWWLESSPAEMPTSPLHDSNHWINLLQNAGFSVVHSTELSSTPWSATLFVAIRTEPRTRPQVNRNSNSILVVTSPKDLLGEQFCAYLREAELSVELVEVPLASDGAMFCAAVSKADPIEIVMLPPPPSSIKGTAATAADRLASVLTVARLATDARDAARVWIVTYDAQQVGSVPEGWAPAREAALWGLVRTLCNESPGLDCRLVDFPSTWDADSIVARLAEEIATPDNEREIVWNSAGRHGLRLRAGLPTLARGAGPVGLTVGQFGLIDTLRWTGIDWREPGPDEIAMDVHAVGLNFRDVMWAMDLLPEEALLDGFAGPTLGLECSGIITAIGTRVKNLQVGDRVVGLAPAAFASRVITNADAVVQLPESITFAAGATIPVAYLTAAYSLGHLARLKAGEIVLIHGGAGGVGLSAIQYAKHCGAIVVATAGTEVKRAFLRELGVDHVFDSRNLAFVDEVSKLTCGQGVDVVLNSLSGDAMERSLGLLRPFGRFLELGKRDFYMNTRVGLRPLRQNISYYAIDADSLLRHTPELAASLLKKVVDLIAEGAMRPLPHRVFASEDVAEAFRLMQGAGHIGKIVVVPEELPSAPAPARRSFTVRSDGTYLISGGLSGFGLETARWLAARGARHLALIGRRGIDTPGANDALKDMRVNSVDVRAYACDVSDSVSVDVTLAQVRQTMPPLRGIIHAAMVVDDGLLVDLSAERIERVLAPKVGGAINLDVLSRGDPIELFILYSSATSIVGAPGQGSYVAANLALEAIARRRMASGLAALAIGWGPISDVGYLARDEMLREALLRRLHVKAHSASESLRTLAEYWSCGLPVVSHAELQWAAAGRQLPILATATFSDIVVTGADTANIDIREKLAELPAKEAMDIVTALLAEEIAGVMSLAPDRIDHHRPLSELGMDSLMAIEMRLALERRLSVKLPFLTLSDDTTLDRIASRIIRALSGNEAVDEVIETAIRHEMPDLLTVAVYPDRVSDKRATGERNVDDRQI